MKINKIVIVCASYPFGKVESFLENEINFLSKNFDIEVYPIKKYNDADDVRDNIPSNLIYHEPIVSSNFFKRLIKGIFNTAPFWFVIPEFLKLLLYSKDIKKSTIPFIINLISYRTLYSNSNFKNSINKKGTIVYFYWGNTPIRYFKTNNKVLVRVHGGEIDKERNYNFIPDSIFSKKVTYLPISKKVDSFLKNKGLKTYLNRLGTNDFGVNHSLNVNNIINIVTCSNIIPLKRLDLLIVALANVKDIKIEWNHFGDGPLFKEIHQLAIAKLADNITVKFHGRVNNIELMRYYQSNYVDLFVNLSQYEGIPVSIMEALSFGIPCFATNAGATSEIVNEINGKLVDVNFEIKELVDFICLIKSNTQLRDGARNYWKNNYSSENNYSNLVNYIKNI
ncbi:glycosyltransferase [Empedobacter falsenii]